MSAPEITARPTGPAVSDVMAPERVPGGLSTRMKIGGEAKGFPPDRQRAAATRRPLLDVAG
jgi:hypothetical protein